MIINRLTSFFYLVFSFILILFIYTLIEYQGSGYVYILFTLVSNVLLYFGFRKNALFFDTFIGIFFWLGFWLKFSYRIAFEHGHFLNHLGEFDGTGQSFDQVLLITTCGFVGLLIASCVREKFIFAYPEKLNKIELNGLFQLYKNHRKLVLSLFVILFFTISFTNVYFGIYQRGTIPSLVLPYGGSGVYKWLLLFGCASFSALILHFEFVLNKKTSYLIVVISLFESFLTNVSLLSRGMILNVSALVYGVIISLKVYSIKSSYKFLINSFFIFLILFVTSIFLVNQLRYNFIKLEAIETETVTVTVTSTGLSSHQKTIVKLLLDRWVGIEGVMSISSYPKKGWSLWHDAWQETFIYNKNSFYDQRIIESRYNNQESVNKHSISLPGILAFCFYPGSFLFLFFCMFSLGLIAAFIEISIYKLGGKNLILCALLAQVVATRYAHFGYVPRQSFLLFGALYLNLFIFYFTNKLIIVFLKNK